METEKQPKATDKIKEKLEHYKGFQRLIDNELARLDTLIATMGSISSPDFSGMPRGSGDGSSKEEREVLRKIELEDKIRRMTEEEAEIKEELDTLVEQLGDPDERALIEMRYFDRMNWWTISATLFGNEPDYDDHEKRYLKRAFKIHGSALQTLARIDDNQ